MLAVAVWEECIMRKRKLTIELEPDTAAFLDLIHANPSRGETNDFINSLLRQERFRQGYLASHPNGWPRYDLTRPKTARYLFDNHLF